jgi:serum/glucocorticoid-regulated kinase 2
LTKGINFSSFDILETLGSGTFGKVFKVRLKTTGDIYAMKIINKKYLIRNQQLRYAVTECNVLKQAQHPFIITLHYAFQTPDHLYMILDYCPGGDLSFHIVRNLFEEDEARFFIAELILAIEHLHNLDIIYRDLKPENILIDSEGHVRLADFGLAKEKVTDNKIAQSFCGSPAYLAPEMVNRRGVGKSADIYGIGAVLYEMISGTPPFYAHDLNTMYNNISKNKLMLHDIFSDELKDILKLLLNKDPKNRIGVNSKDEIKKHPFFADIDWDSLYRREIEPPINLVECKKELNTTTIMLSVNIFVNV